jgi:SAM-dependent methyltransferase
MTDLTSEQTHAAVRDRYGSVARSGESCCGPAGCGTSASRTLGYTPEELASVPPGADLSLGCGNPRAIADLRLGETVLDLGSGPGLDCFLAAQAVGPTGHVIGVDMTPDMLSRARDNARAIQSTNVEFRLGNIEHLPVADASVDVVISNCVVNLSPDKRSVFAEAFRVLKSGGRLAIADMVATAPLPPEARTDLEALTGCVAGAAEIGILEGLLSEVGFTHIRVRPMDETRELVRTWMPGSRLADYVLSATLEARKP